MVGIGNPLVKKKIIKEIRNSNIIFPTIVHPSVIVYDPEFVRFGRGVVIGANTVLTTNIILKDYVYVNHGVMLSHDVEVAKYSMLMPNVIISAGARIGETVYLGNSVTIEQPVIIPNNIRVLIGTILTNQKSVEEL